MTDSVHPNSILEQLLADTHRPERKATLKSIHAICEAQARGTAKDFSLGAIGAIAESLGVMTRKSLSNPGSAGLVTLIRAWADYVGAGKVARPSRVRDAIGDRLLTIPDPALRALIQARLAERDRLFSQVNLLKAATTIVVDRRPPGLLAPKPGGVELSNSQARALREVLEPAFLSDEGWVEGSDGEVLDAESGRRIFPKGFLSALRAVLGGKPGTPTA
ncbi:MAG: alpha/beta hydrolase fold [Ramlibacter sp.]|jgi:hypothetical protein|nr:alpha/beta hydrolase fold [Ramlibacter sp.]